MSRVIDYEFDSTINKSDNEALFPTNTKDTRIPRERERERYEVVSTTMNEVQRLIR